jgi:predicted neuraminidase
MQTETRNIGRIEPSPDDPSRLEAILPSRNVQNHASNLLPLSNGDLLCAWFSGTQEGLSDISISMSRLKKGERQWSPAERMSDDPQRSEQNPVLFAAPNGRLWLLWTSQESGNQDSAVVMRRVSPDLGETWGETDLFIGTPGTFIRQPIVITDRGDWLLPVFHCVAMPGRKWTGDKDDSAVRISSDQGKTWKEVMVPGSTGCVHMNIVPSSDGTLVAFFRSRWADSIYCSRSRDGGHTWDPAAPTTLPNNNSSIQATALMSGGDTDGGGATETTGSADEGGKTAFWGVPRAPLTLAISEDGGRSWPTLRNLEIGDGYCMTNNSRDGINREYSYPSIRQTPDGRLHITYTYFRQAIKYVCIDEEWARA